MDKYIIGIGAANVDIHGTSRNAVNLHDSNPGFMKISTGGVTRNILENYARLGGNAKLLTVVGNDIYGDKILSESARAGIDITHVRIVPDHPSSTYMSILDNTGEMVVALSDMTIMEKLTIDYLRNNDSIIRGSSLIVCDPSLPREVMDEILAVYSPEIPVFVDPVSVAYASCVKDKIGLFHTAKPNELEVEELSGIKVESEEDLITACRILMDKGLKRVFVSRGSKGCFYMDHDKYLFHRTTEATGVVNVTGAGDAFMSTLIYCYVHDISIEETLRMASAAGVAALRSPYTINTDISLEMIRKISEEKEDEL